jgi:hypothetical protein
VQATRGVHKFSKYLGVNSKYWGIRRVTWSKFHTVDPKTLGANVQNFVAGRPGARDLCTSGQGKWTYRGNGIWNDWRSWDKVIGVVTGLDGRGIFGSVSNSDKASIWMRGSPKVLFNEYRGLSPGRKKEHLPPCSKGKSVPIQAWTGP